MALMSKENFNCSAEQIMQKALYRVSAGLKFTSAAQILFGHGNFVGHF